MFDIQHIPAELQQSARWVVWDYDGAGKKTPRAAWKPTVPIDATKAAKWASFRDVTDAATRNKVGVGFALGAVQDGPTFAGLDLDKCRDPDTGAIEPWAQNIINYFASYTEVSPSGKGLKIFMLAALPEGAKQGKVYKLEIYDRDRYFTVTGNHLPTSPKVVVDCTAKLRELHDNLWSHDLLRLVRLFGFYIADRGEWVDIRCPWADGHSTPNKTGDASLHLTKGVVDGFHCFHASCSEQHDLGDVRALFGLKGTNLHDFLTDTDGRIVARNAANIRRALEVLGVTGRHDVFADRLTLVSREGRVVPLDDAQTTRLYLSLEETFHFAPPKDYFLMVVEDFARSTPVHPVRDYLNGLKWDGRKRVDNWLVTYGGAKASDYVCQVGARTLIAAVRRIRQPGAKHDEMLVLISSKQGMNKSTALATLCPSDWFSDDLPLHVDSKQIIERTLGKWIIEASDLAGMRKSDVEHLKAMLSRTVDGPVRMAYGHYPVERPRSFIIVGTTNSNKYLKDSTGNRRFWPVTITAFDVVALQSDRDQLWAEAAAREARGESNRLDPVYWGAAARAQAASLIDDPWLDTLSAFLECDAPSPDPDKPSFIPHTHTAPRDRVRVEHVWEVVGLQQPDRRDERAAARLEAVMQALGYRKKQARGIGKPDEEDDKSSQKRWCREEQGDDE